MASNSSWQVLPLSSRALVFLSLLIPAVVAENNVYDRPMTDCGSDHASGCTYVAYDAGAHEVCVTQLPQGFSSQTGQGPWSDEFTGQPWCICIWAYSNYILQNKDLALKCNSIPLKVLEEQYSLDKFKQCGAMSSTEGCGPEDIRRSIQSLCEQCSEQAEDAAAKTALQGKCDAILASAPAAQFPQLYAGETSEQAGHLKTKWEIPPLAGGFFAMMIAGFGMGALARTYLNAGHIVSQDGQERQGLAEAGSLPVE